jgi:hypothetical protein
VTRLAVVALISATAPSPVIAERPEESWNRRIQETVAALKSNETTKAYTTIDAVLGEMADRANPGKSAHKGIGMGLMLRGLARAQRGEERLAIWDWHLAQQFDPALESWNLDEFAGAGATLATHRLSADPGPELLPGEELLRRGGTPLKVLRRGREPRYASRSRDRRWQGTMRLSAIVDEQGRPGFPRILVDPGESGMLFEACEFLAAIEFEPAKLDGRPLPSLYELNYSVTLK